MALDHPAELPSAPDLAADGLPLLPAMDTHAPVALVVDQGVALHVADLLDAGAPDAGGFLFFDHQSAPGSTIVRVMLDDAESHQSFALGSLPGSGIDLGSLLGLIAPDNGHG
jgi:hypothetical protein